MFDLFGHNHSVARFFTGKQAAGNKRQHIKK
jgi:hypothetical protein